MVAQTPQKPAHLIVFVDLDASLGWEPLSSQGDSIQLSCRGTEDSAHGPPDAGAAAFPGVSLEGQRPDQQDQKLPSSPGKEGRQGQPPHARSLGPGKAVPGSTSAATAQVFSGAPASSLGCKWGPNTPLKAGALLRVFF